MLLVLVLSGGFGPGLSTLASRRIRERAGSGATAETDPNDREPDVARDSRRGPQSALSRFVQSDGAHAHPSVASTARAIRAAVGEQDATGVAAGYRLDGRWVRERLTHL